MTDVAWRHFAWQVPDTWEMLLFSRDQESGQCVFADRYMHRLEFNWQRAERAPDFARMLADCRNSLTGEPAVTAVCDIEVAGWRGLAVSTAAGGSSRFGRYFAGERCLVELVFVWPERRDLSLEADVLASVRETPRDEAGRRHWRAFGLDVRVPEELALQSCRALPGRAEMVFRDAKGRREERFQRLGLVPQWLRGTVAEWLNAQIPAAVTNRSCGSETRGRHERALIRGDGAGAGVARLLGHRQPWQAAAWICPEDGRLYSWITIGRAGAAGHPGQLSCCAAAERTPP
ncbi:MAG: hypothetical protein BWZ02_01944 [Lentisphaerae bacterium ADurb.BinA184]|nr:MAG: hypothetical protein BWZ02_01944 [Lentisphaerae bacterium ADurb.BinA184]